MARVAQPRRGRQSIPRVGRAKPVGIKRQGVGGARPVYRPRTQLANAVATNPVTPATTTAQASNAPSIPQTQSQATDPFQAAGSPQPAPPGLFQLPTFNPQAGQPDPRDPEYWANLAKLKFTREQEYGGILQEQTRADTDYQHAVQVAIRNRMGEQRDLGHNAIRQNLGNSGWLNRNEAEDVTAYTEARAHAQLTKSQEDQAREAAKQALLQGYGLDAAALLAEAASRDAQRRREEAQDAGPEAGESAEPGPSPASKPGGKPKKPRRGRGSGGTTYVPQPKGISIGAGRPVKKGRR